MPGLIRGVARTAVVAGTATAVSNRVSRRQANRWAQQEPPTPAYMAPVGGSPPPGYAQTYPEPPGQPQAAGPGGLLDRLTRLGQLRDSGVLTEAEFAAQKAAILGT